MAARVKAVMVAAPCLLGAAYLGLDAQEAARVSDADELVDAGAPREALDEARAVERRPSLLRARLVEARALAELGRYGAAVRAYERAAALSPRDWTIRRDWAVALARTGDRDGARREIGNALVLNPRMELPPDFSRAGAAD